MQYIASKNNIMISETTDVAEKLKAIAGKATTTIRIAAANELGVHPVTIDRYLRGNAKKERFAVKLLDFLELHISA